jgi:hypothetical protein
VDYPPDLLDELARVFARVALDKLLEELAEDAQRARVARDSPPKQSASPSNVVDEEAPG